MLEDQKAQLTTVASLRSGLKQAFREMNLRVKRVEVN